MRSKENLRGAGCLPWFLWACLGVAAVVVLAGVAYEVTGYGINIWSPAEDATATMDTVAREERPGWDEFLYVMEHDDYERDLCEQRFGSDLDECYYKLGDVDWWRRRHQALTEPWSITTATTTRRPRAGDQYQADQYGCHDDGRCLDDYDTWCDENDIIEFELTGESICRDSYDIAYDRLLDRSE